MHIGIAPTCCMHEPPGSGRRSRGGGSPETTSPLVRPGLPAGCSWLLGPACRTPPSPSSACSALPAQPHALLPCGAPGVDPRTLPGGRSCKALLFSDAAKPPSAYGWVALTRLAESNRRPYSLRATDRGWSVADATRNSVVAGRVMSLEEEARADVKLPLAPPTRAACRPDGRLLSRPG